MGDTNTVYTAHVDAPNTEWHDIHVKYGNFEAKEPKWKPEKFQPKEDLDPLSTTAMDAAEDAQALADLEIDDDRFLEEYRRQRIAAMKEAAARPRFGTYESIKANEWEQHVTRAGGSTPDVFVVVHLYKDHVSQCVVMNECLTELAERYPRSKFVRIISTDAIPNYPDQALPTLLIYQNGKKIKDIVGLEVFGGRRVTPEEVALGLNVLGPICAIEGDENGEESSAREVRRLIEKMAQDRAKQAVEDDEDSDFDDE